MRRRLAAILSSVVLSLAAVTAAHAQADAGAARAELNEGARAYRDGRFEEAERRFRRALELDPTQKNAPVFIARAVQQQYKPGDETPENVAVGERAVAAYHDILNSDPQNEDAYKAIVFLYGQMKRDEKVVELLTERANNFTLPEAKRAEFFVILASRKWQCSYDITERKENQTKDEKPEQALIRYRMPADAGDFIKARQCVDEGLQLAEQAAALDSKSAGAWAYKANLLREASKLAEMEGDAARKADYDRQYAEAFDEQKRTSAEAARKEREGQRSDRPAPATTPEPPAPPEPKSKRAGGSFAVLNGRAVSKPEPEYPAAAKAAGAQGSVAVWVDVDERGNVVEAEAVSGHPLLRAAAVAAARLAKFSPTLLSGRPAGTKGIVTYNFVLRTSRP